MGDDQPLYDQFKSFCNFGAGAGVAKDTITDKNVTKMFKDAKIYSKNLTTTDTDIAFSKIKAKGKKEMDFDGFKQLLLEIASKYAKEHRLVSAEAGYEAIVKAIVSHGPSLAGTTGVSKTGGVDRMTDHTQYTGSHKERFDDTGKGKGLQGRQEMVKNDGYVGNYKGAGTYDATHQ